VAGFSVGDRVTQVTYGTGTVTAANERHIVIDFDEHGLRTFSTPLVRLERSTSAAPARATKTRRKKAAPKAAAAAAE
jgi:hypothetical protein